MKKFFFAVAAAVIFILPGGGAESAEKMAAPPAKMQGSAAQPKVHQFKPGMTMRDFAGHPKEDLVQLGNHRVKVGTLQNLEKAAGILRAPRVDRTPAELRYMPDRNKYKTVASASDLSAALKLPDSTTVKLPSGRLATVGQIKFLQKTVDQKSGGRLVALSQRPSLSGRAIMIPADMSKTMTKEEQGKYWADILKKPGNTVLESPHGTRITVNELKQALGQGNKGRPQEPGPSKAPLKVRQRRPQ